MSLLLALQGAPHFSIVGQVTVSFTPAAQMAVKRRLVGAVTTTFTPAAAMAVTRVLAGNVTTTFTPAATMAVTRALVGAVTVRFTPAAVMAFVPAPGPADSGDRVILDQPRWPHPLFPLQRQPRTPLAEIRGELTLWLPRPTVQLEALIEAPLVGAFDLPLPRPTFAGVAHVGDGDAALLELVGLALAAGGDVLETRSETDSPNETDDELLELAGIALAADDVWRGA